MRAPISTFGHWPGVRAAVPAGTIGQEVRSNRSKSTFLLDLGRRAGTEVRRHAAINDVEQVDRFPLLALGGVDRGQDEVVLVEQRYTGLVAGRVGRIQSELGQKAFPRRISGSDLLELEQIGPPGLGVFMDAIEMWFIPKACTLQIDGPFRISEIAQGFDEPFPIVAGARWRR